MNALQQRGERVEALTLITELEFKSLSAQGFNRIPLMAEAFADLETPLSLYLKLAFSKDGGKYSFLAGIRGWRRAIWPLQLHWSASRTLVRASGFGADAITEVVRRHGGGDITPAIRWTSSLTIKSASRLR
jgi:anthranilate synthase component 1